MNKILRIGSMVEGGGMNRLYAFLAAFLALVSFSFPFPARSDTPIPPGSTVAIHAFIYQYQWWSFWPIPTTLPPGYVAVYYAQSADGHIPSAIISKANDWSQYWVNNLVALTVAQHQLDSRNSVLVPASDPSCFESFPPPGPSGDLHGVACNFEADTFYNADGTGQLITGHVSFYYTFWVDWTAPCPSGTGPDPDTGACAPVAPPPAPLPEPLGPPAQCTGNPCDPATGNKYQNETDFQAGEGLASFTRNYNSQLSKDVSFGFGWTALTLKRLEISGTNIQVRYDTGKGEPFSCPSGTGTCSGNADTTLTLTKDASGYTLTRRNGATERYDTSGRLLTETDRNGLVTSYAYNGSNQLTSIIGPYGHVTAFAYSGTHISSLTDPSGRVYSYTYDANNNLSRVSYPDGAAKLYHYENASFPHHLTGISYQEAGGSPVRYSTYAYDSTGKAIVTEHAGGIEHYGLAYDSDTQTTVTDAVGTQNVMTFASNLGVKNLLNKVNPADGKSLTQTFDAQNNLTCKKDEEGRVTTYTYNSTNQRTSLTEGLTGSCTSPQVTSATRTTSYQYQSATLDLPTLIQTPSVAPGQMKTTTLQYTDAAHPALPTQITQSGYTSGGNAVSRSISLTYTAAGQVASVNGARTDVNDVTTLSYYTCTTGGACGQLQSITNALGQITTFDAYDGAGRLTQMTDPNGLRTNYAYDARGRVTTITQTPPGGSARVTTYTYNAANNVTSVTFPDGILLTYTYDAAQKLRQVTDNQGNKVVYTYDLKGNRTQEATYDPANTLVRQIDTAYDLRNHVSAINNGGSVTQQLSDALGNLTRLTDPNQVAAGSGVSTNHNYDALNRLVETVNNLSGVTSYDYDVADRLIQAKAPNNATTQYQYDDLGNLLQEISLDRGTTTYTYDAAGNVTSLTDARGVVVNYTYDALNRVTAINYPASSGENITLTYDTNGAGTCTAGLGRLCQVTDESGITQYAYDAYGNLTQQTKAELGITYTTRYTYDAANRLASLTYPDNRVVTYTRDSLGRIQNVTTTVNASSQTIITNRTYRPDGLPTGQTYGNGLSEVRTYDARGNLTYQSLGGADTRLYTYDANGNLTQKQTLPEVGNYTYDAENRLTDELTSDNQHNAFTYDPNGNRTSDLKANGTPRPYAYSPNTNRLTALGNQVITLDAAGNTTIDRNGNRVFTYNNANRLTQVSINGVLKGTYTYNYQTQRTRKVRANATGTGTSTFIYHYDINGNVIAETRPNGKLIRAYLWADNEPIAQIQTKGTNPEELSYLHSDHLNTPRLATNSTQTVVWRFESEAFGTGKPDTDPDADDTKTNIRLRFPGQYGDGETGLYYNINRYYDPKIGRYITADRMGPAWHVQRYLSNLGAPGEPPLELNSYVYTANNPLRWIDPTGLWSISIGGYLGAGGEMTFGRDSGNGFFTARVGFGVGGGVSYDPLGGIPGQEPKDRCKPGTVLSVSGKGGFGLGPFGTSLEGGVARNYSNQESGFYGGPSIEGTSDRPSRGLHASASFGGQITAYSGSRNCGCQQ